MLCNTAQWILWKNTVTEMWGGDVTLTHNYTDINYIYAGGSTMYTLSKIADLEPEWRSKKVRITIRYFIIGCFFTPCLFWSWWVEKGNDSNWVLYFGYHDIMSSNHCFHQIFEETDVKKIICVITYHCGHHGLNIVYCVYDVYVSMCLWWTLTLHDNVLCQTDVNISAY